MRLLKTTMAVFALLILISILPWHVIAQNNASILNFPYYDPTAQELSGCGDGSLIGNENAEKVFNFFVSKGYQPFQAAGIVGNMMYESGVLPQRLQGTPTNVVTPAESLSSAQLSNGSLGWGIVQFTPPGKFINTFTNKSDANSLEAQVDFVWNQLEGNTAIPEKRAGDEIKATTSVEEAVKAFQGTTRAGGQYFGYERPADQSGTIAKRTAFAIDALTRFGSGTSGGTNGSGCQLDASGCPTGPISESETVTVAETIKVHPCISAEVERIIQLANEQGLNMSGGGYRDNSAQIEARKRNCGTSDYDIYDKPADECSPPTAQPGSSNHERGTAVDFTCDGSTFSSHSHPCYIFLIENTKLKNLPTEAWHWSIDGS
jgi:hypothetical protein